MKFDTVTVPTNLLTLGALSELGTCLKYPEQVPVLSPDAQVLYDLFLQHVPKAVNRHHKTLSLHRDKYTEKQLSWIRWDGHFAPPYTPNDVGVFGDYRIETDRGPNGIRLTTSTAVWNVLCFWENKPTMPWRNSHLTNLYYGNTESRVTNRIWVYLVLAAYMPDPVYPEVDLGPESTR